MKEKVLDGPWPPSKSQLLNLSKTRRRKINKLKTRKFSSNSTWNRSRCNQSTCSLRLRTLQLKNAKVWITMQKIIMTQSACQATRPGSSTFSTEIYKSKLRIADSWPIIRMKSKKKSTNQQKNKKNISAVFLNILTLWKTNFIQKSSQTIV